MKKISLQLPNLRDADIRSILALLFAAAALSGCVADIAAGALNKAIRSAKSETQSNAHLAPKAESACTAKAAPHGKVHIIDVEQRRADKIVIWGTTGETQRKSFECHFGTAVNSFKLRDIKNQSAGEPKNK